MGGQLNKQVATYRLVYFQPEPEDGERVCIALLFNFGRDLDLLYDRDFPKLKCLAPDVDPALVNFYLEEMVNVLRHSQSDVDVLIGSRTPQLAASEPRRVSWPLSDSARLQLIARFLGKQRRGESRQKPRDESAE